MSKIPQINVPMKLSDRFNVNPIVVSMESFFEFTFWMSEELDDLVAIDQLKNQRNGPVKASALSCTSVSRGKMNPGCKPFTPK